MLLPTPNLPTRYRVPALCVLVSLALHWIALSVLLHTPNEFRVVAPAPSLRIAMPARDDPATGPVVSVPVPVLSAPAPARPAPATDAAMPAQRATLSSRPEASGSAPAAQGAAAPGVAPQTLPRALVHPAPVPQPGAAAATPRESRRAPADDRGIETTDQYRMALLFEAGRLRAGVARGTGRSRVELQFAAGGVLQGTRVRESSGDETLDAAAIELMQRAHAQLPVPAVLRQRAFAIEASISFEAR